MNPSSVKDDKSLPEGWVIKTSRSQKGKEYFCNPSRKISLWSLPEVLAFERGLRQLENTSPSKKFKPVTGSADPGSNVLVGEGSSQPTLPDASAKAGLQQQEKPFRMTLKATRRLPQTNKTLEDCITEAASFCSSRISPKGTSASGKQFSQSLTQSSHRKGVSQKRSDASLSPTKKPVKSSEGVTPAKRCFSDVEKEERSAGLTKSAKAESNQDKAPISIRSSQLGSSASKLWDKLFSGKKRKPPSEKAKEKTDQFSGSKEEEIKGRLAAIRARIDAQSNYVYGTSRSKLHSTTGTAQASSVAAEKHVSAALPSSRAGSTSKGTCSKIVTSAAATQKPRNDVTSPRERPQTGVSPSLTAPSTSARHTGVNQAQKRLKTNLTTSSGRQLYDQPPKSIASTAQQKNPPPASGYPPLNQRTAGDLTHYTIPKRSSVSSSTVVSSPAAPSPALSPAPSTSLPSQSDPAALVAVVTPFVSSSDSAATPATVSGASLEGAVAPSPTAAAPAPSVQRQPPGMAMVLGSDAAVPPPPEDDDGLELMELDEPDLNDEEVLSQIACLRDASCAPSGSDVPWSGGSDTSTAGRGGETAALLAGWEPPPVEPAAPRSLTVVLDTNVLIHGVGFVLDLRDAFIEGVRPQLLIPWVVVQELDGLKQADRPQTGHQTNVSTKARAAIAFLLECFQARHPAVRGQTTAEAAAARGQLEGRVADDAILECCLAAGRQGEVLLLSDDKNLLTKVLLHGLTGVSRQQLLQATDLCGVTEHLPVTEENQICFTKTVLRKVLSYVIRREMPLAYGAAWHALPAVRRPWWSLRDLVSVVCGHRTVFRTVFADCWARWQQVFKLATRPVLSAVEQGWLCAGVAGLLPLLQPSSHYQRLVRPLAAALQAGVSPPAGPLAALGASLGVHAAGWPDPATRTAEAEEGGQAGEQGTAVSLADVISQQGQEAASSRTESRHPLQSGQENGVPRGDSCRDAQPEEPADRQAAATPPPPDDMDSQGGPDMDSTAVLDLFQGVWNYVNTCCGVLLDAAGVAHPYRYERPPVPPTPAQCAAFLPELGTAVQTLTTTLKRLMAVSVVALASDHGPLATACDALHALVTLAGHETYLTPLQLLRFIRSPANRLLLGKGLEQLTGFLKTLEELHRMVS